MFSFPNAGKKGITLNLKTQPGVEIFKKLIKDADVLVENKEILGI
jgi:CoA:oxalate CoA-transferase